MSKSIAATTPIGEVRRWMASRHIDAAYITRPVSIGYLTGFFADPIERLMALAVRDDRVTLIVPALEREKAAAQAENADVVAWRDGEDAYGLVARTLAGCREIAVEKEHLTLQAAEVLTTRSGVSELVDIGTELRRLRLIKQPDEIAKLVRAAAITDSATDEVMSRASEGQSEVELALILGTLIGDLGGSLSFETLVQSGPNSALPHARPSNRKLETGDFVLLDFGAAFEGYKADTTRMAVVGEPTERHRELHQLVLDAHDAALAVVRPGATTGEVDAAARRAIEAAGFGEYFFHRVGHGLGLETHEDPSLDPGSQTVVEAGMVFTIEPGVYIPGWGGVRIEDDVVVEQSGCRLLTNADRSLRIIEAR